MLGMAGVALALSPRRSCWCSQAGEPQSTAWPWGERAEGPLLVPAAVAGCSPGLAPLQAPGLWDALVGRLDRC